MPASSGLGQLPWWAWSVGGLWLLLIGAWSPVLLQEAITSKSQLQAVPVDALVLIALAVLASVGWGFVLALLQRWRWILVSAPVGTVVLLVCYVIARFATNPTDPQVASAAGATLAIFWVPILVLVGLLLAVGGGLGSAYRRLRSRSTAAVTE
jgi:hypothetical protein